MKKFWNWIKNESGERILRLEGPIDEESIWGDEITPKAFRDELNAEDGDVTVWLNSPGGNVFAASEIYTMLRDYKGSVTVKIDAVAASAASVIAMAGNHVAMSPTAMLMIHDPSTLAYGNAKDMEKAIEVLNEVKESIINAYVEKSGLSRTRVANLMTNETWMNAKKAVELGFADEILFAEAKKKDDDSENEANKPNEEKESDEGDDEEEDDEKESDDDDEKKKPFQLTSAQKSELSSCLYSSRQMGLRILNSLCKKERKQQKSQPVIGMDGKTENGAMPYAILMNQLECMR